MLKVNSVMNAAQYRSTVVIIALVSLALLWVPVAHGEAPAASEANLELEPVEVGQPERIEVFPPSVQFAGRRSRVQFVVTGIYPDGRVQDLTRVAEFASSDPEVISIRSAVGVPEGNGQADVEVRVAGADSAVAVKVSNQDQPHPVSFEYDMLAALSKQGCNAGACHGSPSGKGGFRLSLRAFDPELDKLTLVREHVGRRTNPIEPSESLLLLKPLMKVSHGGGRRLNQNDPAYQVMHDWIAEGCRTDPANQARCVKLELYPRSGRLLKRPAHTQQLSVRAHFSDGSVRDVTDLAVYSSSDESVASVREDGLVIAKKRGDAAIIVRYLEFIESTSLTFIEDIEGYEWEQLPVNNDIDKLVDARLRELKYLPSGLCSDEEFIRRVYLDVIGTLPPIEKAREFLADDSTDKRARLIDRLLDHPDFAKFWALKWGDLLRLTQDRIGEDAVHKYHRWIERAVASNMPYDQFARRLLTAQGSTHANPPANFYRTAADTSDCVETVSQVFLGARLRCAKCHNHPFERWTQDNYYGMAAFFNRVQRKNTPRPGETLVWVSRSGEVTQPRTGEQMKPWLPGQGEVEQTDVNDRRRLFASWLTQPENPFFAKIEVNRIWSYLLGRGIVDPTDDFRDSNPPSNPPLLEALAEDFVSSGFDRKHVIRTILNSRTYQASVETNEFNKDETEYFSHRQPRLMTAEQLLDAIGFVTGVPETFDGLPERTKATHLPAPDLVKSGFLEDFGQPKRKTVCQCERSEESNLGMAIQFYNGPLIDRKLKAPNNRFRELIKAGKTDAEIIRQLHLAAYCRQPTDHELATHLDYIASKEKQLSEKQDSRVRRGKAFEDVCWALLTSNEFLLQH